MLDCLILGDSIAQGISNIRKECTAIVKGGINSYNWNNRNIVKDLSANTVIISLGTNDPDTMNTFKELLLLRQQIYAKKVMWVMPPIKPSVQDIVRIIANSYSDTILTIPELSKDKVHPTYNGYKQLAEQTK
jgi:lysophospholipase L1-like esterase